MIDDAAQRVDTGIPGAEMDDPVRHDHPPIRAGARVSRSLSTGFVRRVLTSTEHSVPCWHG
jgi:hypothetical protein